MTDIKSDLKALLALQDKDSVLDARRARAADFPLQIARLRQDAEDEKRTAEDKKKNLQLLQVERKSLELELENRDAQIRKHNGELNAVKTNEAYRALLSEIDRLKLEKSAIEDKVLASMEAIETETAVIRGIESNLRSRADEISAAVAKCEAEHVALNAEITSLEADRSAFAAQISPALIQQYEFIRESRSGSAVAWIDEDSCSCCHTVLRPQIINEVMKETSIIFCDNCSRVLVRR